jgi:signal transduction histidine kinase
VQLTTEIPRSSDDVIALGAAGGFAAHVRAHTPVVRALLVVLSVANGLGLVVYLALVVMSGSPVAVSDAPRRGERSLSLVVATFTVLIASRSIGWWSSDAIVVPTALVATAVTAVQLDADGTSRLSRVGPRTRYALRVALGLVCAVAGLLVLADQGGLGSVGRLFGAGAVVAIGTVLLAGPWLRSTVSQLTEERNARIRSDERSVVASHVHDSVLQTLALMQRNVHDPRRMVSLARRQERELRSWLYVGEVSYARAESSLAQALGDLASEVEIDFDVPIEVVVVGTCTPSPMLDALCGAVREAAINAARHSGAASVSVYAEVASDRVIAFVRDKGRGFDVDGIGDDRRGVRDSIHARLQRVGGAAIITSVIGGGTEVELWVPVSDQGVRVAGVAGVTAVAATADDSDTRSVPGSGTSDVADSGVSDSAANNVGAT